MNPYAKFLGDRDPFTVIAATPQELERAIGRLTLERAIAGPAPGKWSAREIACHLADCEVVFAFRFRQTVAAPNYIIQPFDQEKWAAVYSAYDAAAAVAAFSAARHWNLLFLKALRPEAFSTPVTHPERGTMTLQTLVETMAGHDLNHLGQIGALHQEPAAKTAGATGPASKI
ncbi:MAG: DinB family protein [Bryobacteraceae bacterium]